MPTTSTELIAELNLNGANAAVVATTFEKLAPEVAAKWLSELKIKDNHVAHTFSGEMADQLTFNQFTAFYAAIGIDIKRFSEIQDKVCKQVANACYDKTGSTCDDSYC